MYTDLSILVCGCVNQLLLCVCVCVCVCVCSEFLHRGASNEVNVSAKVQEEVEKDLKSPSRYSFTAAQVCSRNNNNNNILDHTNYRFCRSKYTS